MVTDVQTVTTLKSKLSLDATASKYKAVMDGLPGEPALFCNMLATYPIFVAIGAKLQELVADFMMRANIFIIKVKLKSTHSR